MAVDRQVRTGYSTDLIAQSIEDDYLPHWLSASGQKWTFEQSSIRDVESHALEFHKACARQIAKFKHKPENRD